MADTITKEWTHPALEKPITVDFKLVYCDDCGGKGKVDIDGLRGSSKLDEMFIEDPEFEEEYRNTDTFQQPCPTCKGEKHHEVVVFESIPLDVLDKITQYEQDERADERYAEQERRMGA